MLVGNSEHNVCWNCGHHNKKSDVICENCGMGLQIDDEMMENEDISSSEIISEIETPQEIAEGNVCWNCGHHNLEGEIVCENCGMGLQIDEDMTEVESSETTSVESQEEETFATLDELDSLLDDTEDVSLGTLGDELDALLEEDDEELDIDSILKESSVPEIPQIVETKELTDEKATTSPAVPAITDVSPSEDVFVAEPENLQMPAIPTFDDFAIEKEEEIEQELSPVYVSKASTSTRKFLSLMGQYFYWFFVYLLIGILSIDLQDPNVLVQDIPKAINENFFVIRLSKHLFLGVFVFLPMGWFFSYKLKQWNVTRKAVYGFLFIIGQFFVFSILTLGLLLLNPGVVFSLYLIMGWADFWISFLLGGVLMFFAGYNVLFDPIYKISPMHELEELESLKQSIQ